MKSKSSDGGSNRYQRLYTLYAKSMYNFGLNRLHLPEEFVLKLISKSIEITVVDNHDKLTSEVAKKYLAKTFNKLVSEFWNEHRMNQKTLNFCNVGDNCAGVFLDLDSDELKFQLYVLNPNDSIINLINEALKKLDENDVKILKLKALNFSFSEISKELKIHYKTIEMQYLRARSALVDSLNKDKTLTR